jgi:hypothetical protein
VAADVMMMGLLLLPLVVRMSSSFWASRAADRPSPSAHACVQDADSREMRHMQYCCCAIRDLVYSYERAT